MLLVLQGLSAYRFWLHAPARPATPRVSDERILVDALPSKSPSHLLRETLPHLEPPFHLLCAQNSRRLDETVVHRTARRYPTGSFLPAASGVFVSSPELTAAQIASRCPTVLLAKAVCMLLGTTALAADERYGNLRREPLTNRQMMGAYLAASPGLPGGAALGRILPHMAERVASPAEADLTLALCLPVRLGGRHLPLPAVNHRIDLSPRAQAIAGQRFAVVDLCWRERGLALEYDADLTHLNPEQHARDASRRAALEADGYRVLTVTTEHLYGPRSLEPIADEVRRHLGIRRRPEPPGFRARQASLRRLPRGFDLPATLFD